MTADASSCLVNCQNEQLCQWFTFDAADNACILTTECSFVDETCTDCTYGQKQCDSQTGTYKYSTSIGVLDSWCVIGHTNVDSKMYSSSSLPIEQSFAALELLSLLIFWLCSRKPKTDGHWRLQQGCPEQCWNDRSFNRRERSLAKPPNPAERFRGRRPKWLSHCLSGSWRRKFKFPALEESSDDAASQLSLTQH